MATGLSVGFPAYSYSRISGANDRINIAVAGLNGRGLTHLLSALKLSNAAQVVALCDVDSGVYERLASRLKGYGVGQDSRFSRLPRYTDFRVLMESPDVDLVTIATPDHWHALMAIMAMEAGKHVMVEKPCSHNPKEGEWMVEVQKRTRKKLQVFNQQRSASTSKAMVEMIRSGEIGEPYYARAWYADSRKSIGTGEETAVPAWLNWELWQGPAPRRPFRDNVVHYNWHWKRHWGTGEVNHSGIHELDICRWALGVDFPSTVTSTGGKFHFDDDWEFFDTQVVNFQFPRNRMISWEGRSCNSMQVYNRSRGVIVHGTKGTAILDRQGVELYDANNNQIIVLKERSGAASPNVLGVGGLDDLHMKNLLDAIREDKPLNSPIDEGHKSALLGHLANMAQISDSNIELDSLNGRPLDTSAMKHWGREYEPGWKPQI